MATIRIDGVSGTTNYITMFELNRQSREKTITAQHAFQRMISSAKSSPAVNYWFGKVIYY